MIPTGDKNFWIAQAVGWSLMAGTNLFIQYLAGLPTDLLLYNSLTPFIVGFLLTSIYRFIIKGSNWKAWSLGKTIFNLLASTALLTSVFMLLVFFVFRFLFREEGMTIVSFLGNIFIFTLVMLTWNLIYFSIHYFNNWNQAEIEKWKLAAEMKDAQLGSLKSQINPHFIFNTINNIRSLILEDKEKARAMLLNFSDLFRYALKNNDQSKVELKDELSIVQQYLELLSIQYESKLQYDIQVDEGLEDFKLPPMMLQLLVENAVKHGISQFKEGGSIFIEIDHGEGFLNLKVKNTGNLKTSSSLGDKLGVGLENIRKRLELIYNGNANLKMIEENNNVIALIKIPIV
ncbi:MAG: histidine kinase [Bacteroidota bacterium]